MKHSIVQQPFLTLPTSFAGYAMSSEDKSMKSPAEAPLQGLRLAVKDLFHMAGLPTTAGNPTWLATHALPTHTASSVTQLLQAGAEFVGKTITDELAYSLNGQNIHYGTPQNPVTPERLPGGSSSGSAVAVAARLAEIGLGTDTGGSIRVPSSYNGLFGLRPTHGVIATDHMVGLAPSFDTIGFMTRDLDSLAKVANTLLPAATRSSEVVFSKCLIANALIENVAHKDQLNALLEKWHAEATLPPSENFELDAQHWQTGATFRTLQGAEIWQEHGQWIEQHDPDFAPDIQSRFTWTETITAHEIERAKQQRQAFRDWLDGQLQDTVLILPTTPGCAPLLSTPDAELADYRNQLLELTAIAGLGGYPQLHLPMCDMDGAPCGLSLLGPRGSDLALIAFAQSLME